MLVALVRDPDESLAALLARLDAALEEVMDGGEPVNEINEPARQRSQRPGRTKRTRRPNR